MTETGTTTPPNDHLDRWRTVRQFAYVDRAFRDVRRHVASAPARILGDGCNGSAGDGDPTVGLHVRRVGLDLVRDVRMVMGELEVGIHNARLPLRWEDGTHPDLFPILEATFELAPISAGRNPMTQLGLFGRYQPPLGRLGRWADTLAGRRIVLESVEVFLDELAHRLERELPAARPGAACPDWPTPEGWRRVSLPVDGLNRRPGGAAGVQLLLEAIPGVIAASVNPRSELAVIDYTRGSCSVHQLQEALDGAPSSENGHTPAPRRSASIP